MSASPAAVTQMQPVAPGERYRHLDVLRGVALFGVLLVNLLTLFRVSLFQHLIQFHTHPGRLNYLVDSAVAAFVEFKAFTLFSFLFGVGTAIQAERCAARGMLERDFLVRRFFFLGVIGIVHMFLIWNGDILILYAVCGLLMVGTVRLSPRTLAILGFLAILLPGFVSFWVGNSGPDAWREQVNAAGRVYSQGSYREILAFRWTETWNLILPLLWSVLLRTLGLMWLGAAAWRGGLLRQPQRYHRFLWLLFLAGCAIGGTSSLLHAHARATGRPSPLPGQLEDLVSVITLAFAYGAGALLWVGSGRAKRLAATFAAAGQMALTNYLTESVVLGFVFYGYGLGLFGRLGPAAGLAIAITLYSAQLAFSLAWLRRYRFGPVEWLWRSLTYGRLQAM